MVKERREKGQKRGDTVRDSDSECDEGWGRRGEEKRGLQQRQRQEGKATV